MNDQQLVELLQKVPRELPVDDALWVGVENRLKKRGQKINRQAVVAIAVSLLLLLGAVMVLELYQRTEIKPSSLVSNPTERPIIERHGFLRNGAGMQYANHIESEFGGVQQHYRILYSFAASSVPEDLTVELIESLDLIEQSARDIRAAIKVEPDAIYLAQLLMGLYQQQMNFLNQTLVKYQQLNDDRTVI